MEVKPFSYTEARYALARDILLDALRVAWTMPTATAETIWGTNLDLARGCVETADALIDALKEMKR